MTIGITAVAAAAVAVGIVTGSLVSLVSGIAVARLARLDPVITMSLAPKSVTAAIAVDEPRGALAIQPAPAPTDAEVAAALATIRYRVQR